MTPSMNNAFVTVFVATALATTCLVVGCVDDNPIVTGKRDASADADTPRSKVVTPLADDPDEDFVGCQHCAQMMDTTGPRDVACRKNNPSSVRLMGALVDCVCFDKCVPECGTYCSGSAQTDPCQACVFDKCIAVVEPCLADSAP